jgi:hypothetical protein
VRRGFPWMWTETSGFHTLGRPYWSGLFCSGRGPGPTMEPARKMYGVVTSSFTRCPPFSAG